MRARAARAFFVESPFSACAVAFRRPRHRRAAALTLAPRQTRAVAPEEAKIEADAAPSGALRSRPRTRSRSRLRETALRARAAPPRPPQAADAVGTGRSAAAAAASARYARRRLPPKRRDARVGHTQEMPLHAAHAFLLAPSAAEAEAGEKRKAEEPAADEPAAKAQEAEAEAAAPEAEAAPPAPMEAEAAKAEEAPAAAAEEAPLKSAPVADDGAPKGTPTPVLA